MTAALATLVTVAHQAAQNSVARRSRSVRSVPHVVTSGLSKQVLWRLTKTGLNSLLLLERNALEATVNMATAVVSSSAAKIEFHVFYSDLN